MKVDCTYMLIKAKFCFAYDLKYSVYFKDNSYFDMFLCVCYHTP